MKVLIVTKYKAEEDRISHFVADQIAAICAAEPSIRIEVFGVVGSGIKGYLNNLKALRQKITDFAPDIIHAHYGFCGAMACLQRKVPVVTTYHGSDINIFRNRLVSNFAILFSKFNIFVSKQLADKAICHTKHSAIIPCGISTQLFSPEDKNACRQMLGLDPTKHYVLFPASRTSTVKNFALAEQVMQEYNQTKGKAELIELDGYKREEVPLLINAVDVLLMTSFSEGSPQVIKETIACGCPIVSVPVGDVRQVAKDIPNAFVSANYDANELTELLDKAISSGNNLTGLKELQQLGFDNETIANKIIHIYKQIYD